MTLTVEILFDPSPAMGNLTEYKERKVLTVEKHEHMKWWDVAYNLKEEHFPGDTILINYGADYNIISKQTVRRYYVYKNVIAKGMIEIQIPEGA